MKSVLSDVHNDSEIGVKSSRPNTAVSYRPDSVTMERTRSAGYGTYANATTTLQPYGQVRVQIIAKVHFSSGL